MKHDLPSKWDEAVERKEGQVRRRAVTVLDDSSHDWLRTRRARRTLAGSYMIAIGCMVALWARSWDTLALLGMAVCAVLLLALRVSVRTQADLPDYVLDERQRLDRDRAYVDAFRLVSAVVFTTVAVAFVVVVSRDRNNSGSIEFGYGGVSALFWGCTAVLLGAPSMAFAWRHAETSERASQLETGAS